MLSAGFVSALGTIIYTLWFVGGVYVYVALIRQISARPAIPPPGEEPVRTFGMPEAIMALVLISFLLLNVVASVSAPSTELTPRDLTANVVLIMAVLLLLLGFLRVRGLNLDALAGLSKIGVVRAVTTGALLLIAAYPIIATADVITRKFIGNGSSRQNVVELFNGSRTMDQRIMIIILAVAIAPIAEEFVFRFFLYGVLRRYIGRFGALAFTALLFAAVHAHLPSFAPLFVLGSCFTLAYEWSGSILVSMTMHSLFNALSLFILAFPDLSQQ